VKVSRHFSEVHTV